MSNPRRTRTRNRLYLVGVLPALLMLLVSGRIGLLLVEESQGLSAFETGDFDDARGDFALNQVLNPFEQWIAHFDEGASRHRAGDLDGAVSSYERSLDEDVPEEWECRVRNNLALAHEELGDALVEERGKLAAEDEWLIARQVLEGCVEVEAAKEAAREAEELDDPRDPADADTDQDGEISAEEAAAQADTDQDGEVSPQEAEAAAEADTDEDGVVSADEARAAAEAAADADADGDGEVTPEERAAADAALADADRDGSVSPEESSVVIDDRLADKLADRDPPDAEDAADPPPADETVAERQQRLAERNRRALEQRRLEEQRRESRRDTRSNSISEPAPVPEW
ncbi:hypothetical protein [Nocardioides lijunqiniae]|uniref:hypothetical protein n=1 Tax=Nocardioides lijunqiniae TaxID=2760832 RepID=UPI001878D1DD|nr:hypothetical protein [Nocardioides lijunqiniae]